MPVVNNACMVGTVVACLDTVACNVLEGHSRGTVAEENSFVGTGTAVIFEEGRTGRQSRETLLALGDDEC